MDEKCQYAKCFGTHDWCELSDNICIRNTGNEIFDKPCEYYNDFLKEQDGI